MGDHMLVRRHDRLAGSEGGHDQGVRRLVAADQLDDDVGIVGGHQMGRGVGQERTRQTCHACPGDVANGDTDELEWSAVGGRQLGSTLDQCANDLTADRTRAEDRDAHRRTRHRRSARDGGVIAPNGSGAPGRDRFDTAASGRPSPRSGSASTARRENALEPVARSEGADRE